MQSALNGGTKLNLLLISESSSRRRSAWLSVWCWSSDMISSLICFRYALRDSVEDLSALASLINRSRIDVRLPAGATIQPARNRVKPLGDQAVFPQTLAFFKSGLR
jgi:hypothetical protein